MYKFILLTLLNIFLLSNCVLPDDNEQLPNPDKEPDTSEQTPTPGDEADKTEQQTEQQTESYFESNDLAIGDFECVLLSTSKGDIFLALNRIKAPETVSNFLGYTNAQFYNGTLFHRVIKGFIIQGGGFTETLNKKEANAPIVNESDNGLLNERGTIAMARIPDPHSATSQFFINIANNASLDYRDKAVNAWGYAVFGEVVKGLDIIDEISNVETSSNKQFAKDAPIESIVIQDAKVISCTDI